jgi:uncharacterized protein YpuA (DUF1002 family)
MDTTPSDHDPETGGSQEQAAARLQDVVDHVYETHAEHDEEQVRAALEQQVRELGMELGDELLERATTEIASGNRVDVGPV